MVKYIKIVCQSFMALVVWASGGYEQGDDHFKKVHLDSAIINVKLLKNYVMANEMLIEQKMIFKKDGVNKTPLLNAQKRFRTARKELLEYVGQR